jgi:acyl-CoA thioester hydrolase
MGHVNNAVYATYIEQARVEYIREVVDKDVMETGAVVADLSISFQRPIDRGDDVTVGTRVTELGDSSLPQEYEIQANGETAATGEALMVAYDREAGHPRPMPDEWRERIAAFEGISPHRDD